MTMDTSGPAFPCDLVAYDPEVQIEYEGMSLRDYFAAKAMQADLAGYEGAMWDRVAKQAYEMADAMLKARQV